MSETIVDALNTVLESLTDSVDGYSKAAEIADRERYIEFFERRSTAREKMAGALRLEIERLGGAPEERGTILAKAHRMFLSIASTLEGSDVSAIEAVRTGEIHLRRIVDSALKAGDIDPATSTMLKGFQGEMAADAEIIETLERSAQDR